MGDVWIEIPGKTGFWYSPQSLPEKPTAAQVETIGLGTNGTLPLPILVDLNNETLNGPYAEYIPAADREEVASIDSFFTSSMAGAVVCDTFQGPAGMSSRSWRPFNNTLGWHYTMWGACTPGRGWTSSGFDATVDIANECNDQGTKCLGVQRVKPGSPYFGSMIQSISVKLSNAVTEADVKACCFPPSEEDRDCSAVENVVMGYKVAEDDYSIYTSTSLSKSSSLMMVWVLYVVLVAVF